MDRATTRLLRLGIRGKGACEGRSVSVACPSAGRRCYHGGVCLGQQRSSWTPQRPQCCPSCRLFSSYATSDIRPLQVKVGGAAAAAAARVTAAGLGSPPVEPWKTLLEAPARARWRVASPKLPAAIETARRDVLRTVPPHWKSKAKVLQGVLHSAVFDKHKAMARMRDKERRAAFYNDDDDGSDNINNKKSTSPSSSSSSSQSVLLPYGPVETVAVLQHRLHPHYEIAKRVLLEAKSLTMSSSHRVPVRRVIDFGMGVGSASLAALDVFGTRKSGHHDATSAAAAATTTTRDDREDIDGIEWIHGVDASRTMQEVSGELLRRYCLHKSHEDSPLENSSAMPRFTFSSHLSSSSSNSDASSSSSSAGSSFDLALCCYTAAELTPCAASLAAAAVLWDKLAPGGILVVVEPGTPDGFANVRTIRSMLLDCYHGDDDDDHDEDEDELREECHILAPCTHRGKCPMELYPHKQGVQRRDHSPPPPGTTRQPDGSASDDDEASGADDDDANDAIDEDEDASDEEQEPSGVPGGTRRGYCGFVQAMPGSAGKSLRNKGEKFSYLVVQKRVTRRVRDFHEDDGQDGADAGGNSTAPDLDTNLAKLLRRTQRATHASVEEHSRMIQTALDLEDKYLDSDLDPLGLELLHGDDNRASFGRILHAPIKRRGHVWIDCCAAGGGGRDGDDGRVVRHRVSKSMSKVAPGIYSAARKSRWGGYWPNGSQPSAEDDATDHDKLP